MTSMMFLSSLLMLSLMICKRPNCVGGLSFLLLLAFLHVPGGHAIAVLLVVDFCWRHATALAYVIAGVCVPAVAGNPAVSGVPLVPGVSHCC